MSGSASAIDRFFHYLLARQTGGVSPAGLWLSYLDWAVHLSLAPGTQAKLAWRAMSDAIAFQQYLASVLESADGKAQRVDPAPTRQAVCLRSVGALAFQRPSAKLSPLRGLVG